MAAASIADPWRPGGTPECPFHAMTGLWCPFCGLTRAAWAAGHLRWHLLLEANILAPLFALGTAIALWALAGLPMPAGPRRSVRRRAWWSVGLVLLVFTLLRNLPGLEILAPHGSP